MNAPILPFDRCGETPLERRAVAFDAANPDVYDSLVRLAREVKRHGVRRVGMKALFERLRWDHALKTQGARFKLDNGFTAYYARLLMQRNPELRGLFELRKTASEPYRKVS